MKERREGNMYVVEADGWGDRGSSENKIMFYISRDQLEKCEPRPVVELSTREKIERAKQKKNKGSKYFSEKDFQPALQEYGIGIDVLKMVDYASDNASVDDKAQVIALLIPCYNNLAICHLRLKHFPDAYVAATSVSLWCIYP